MAPNKAGVSSGSFLELRIQVEKHKETTKDKATTAIVGRSRKNGKVRCIFHHLWCPSVTITLHIEDK